MKSAIAVLGAGHMGSALVRSFLAQLHPTTVWNRSPNKLSVLAAAGAKTTASILEAITGADLIVANLTDYASTDAVLSEPRVTEALRGKTLVQLASGSPEQARRTEAWATAHGIAYLDGAIMATPNLIGGEHATLLYSGKSDLFARHHSDLEALGKSHHVGEQVGHASALDSALLIVMWGSLFGVLHGAAICAAEQISQQAYGTFLGAVAGQIGNWTVDTQQRVQAGRFAADSDTHANIAAHDAALRCLLELYEERGLPAAFPETMRQLMDKAISAGQAQDDFARLFQHI